MFRFGLSIDDSFVRIAHLILFRLKIDWYMCTTNGVLLTQLWVQQLIESLNSAFACLIYTTIVPGVCSKQCECVNRKPNMWTIVNWWAVRSISNGVNKNRHQNRMKEKWTKRQRLKQSIRIRTFRASIMLCYLLLFWFFFLHHLLRHFLLVFESVPKLSYFVLVISSFSLRIVDSHTHSTSASVANIGFDWRGVRAAT